MRTLHALQERRPKVGPHGIVIVERLQLASASPRDTIFHAYNSIRRSRGNMAVRAILAPI